MKLHCLIATAVLLLPAGAAFADGDAKAGAVVLKKCAVCHTATETTNRVGPHLVGIVGCPVASLSDYSYSAAMKAFAGGGKIWDEVTLKAYLPNPQAMVKGTKMAFAGLKNPQDVDNVIAYLKDPFAASK